LRKLGAFTDKILHFLLFYNIIKSKSVYEELKTRKIRMGPGLHLLGNEHCDLDFNILLIVLFISLDFHARQWIYKVF